MNLLSATPLNFPAPLLAVLDVVRAQAAARRSAILLIGGAVRDVLLGHTLHDLDFAVQGNPIGLGRAVADALGGDFYVMDAERGTVRVLLKTPEPGLMLDFAACRGVDWAADIAARDFGMNAIGYDLAAQSLFDPAHGIEDLQARRVRTASAHAIDDDPVRALRAIRQAHQLGFEIEAETLGQVQAIGERLLQPSTERIRDEVLAMCALPNAAQALRQLDALGLLRWIVPEVEAMRDCTQSPPHRFTVLAHTFWVLQRLDELIADGAQAFDLSQGDVQAGVAQLHAQLIQPTANANRTAILRLATLLHDCGKPMVRGMDADGRIRFFGHEAKGAELAAPRMGALRLSGDEAAQVSRTIRHHMRLNQFARMPGPPTLRAVYRWVRDVGECAPELALFAMADCYGKRGPDTAAEDCQPSQRIATRALMQYYQRFAPTVAPSPLLTGKDLLEMGLTPGPQIGKLLNELREAQMADEITNIEAARGWIERRR